MRDFLVLAIILGSVPFCFVNPYFGTLMYVWVTYFNPHRFTWSYAHDFPVAMAVAVPTLAGFVFAKKSMRSLFTLESVLLLLLLVWFFISYVHAQGIPLFAGNMLDAKYQMSHVSKIILFTFVMVMLIFTKERLRGIMLVTAGSLGLLAVKSALFGLRTAGESRVWGPPDSFLSDNNAFGLALNMTLPLLFFLARQEKTRWLKILLWITFGCTLLVILLTYSRGALLGLFAVLTAIMLKSRHKIVGMFFLATAALLVLSLAPSAWMDRMGHFMHGNLDTSAEERLISWGTAWNLAKDYPITGGSFDVLPNVDVFQRYEPRPLPLGQPSSAPHSIYFQLLGDQGFVGLGLFLLLIGSCYWSLWRLRRAARRVATATYLIDYAHMVEVSILAFMLSGAFLGFVYLDVIYQMIGFVVILKVLYRRELSASIASQTLDEPAALEHDHPSEAVLA
jgi:probable O-glycosylation ligase (exosortase A-associated)